MKKIFNLTIIVFLMFSCEDILQEKPLTLLTPGGFYTTNIGMESLVKGCYSFARYSAAQQSCLNLDEIGTDIAMSGGGNLTYDGFQLTSSDGSIKGPWDNYYKAINACNNVTKYISEVPDMTSDIKAVREAEVRFLRAYYYYYLVMHFGPIHLTLDATEGVETEANRTPVDQIFDAIKSDLEFAVANLPPTQSNYGRVDAFAAKHFLCRVLLSDTRSQNADFLKAAQFAVDVIDNSGHKLEPTRAAVFNENNEKNNEIVWSVQFPTDEALAAGGNQMHLLFIHRYEVGNPGIIRSIEYQRPYKNCRPTQFQLNLYDEKIDSRYSAYWKDMWLANVDAPANGIFIGDTALYFPKNPMTKEQILSKKYKVYNPESSADLGKGFYRVQAQFFPSLIKFIDTKRASINETRGSRDWVVFRLAETYLFASEAYFKAGDIPNAVKYMNILRRAAALPGKESAMEITATNMSIDFILDERGRELCGELWRWIDLKRTGKSLERIRLYNLVATGRMKDYHVLRPIPQSQIDRTSNKYEQNAGY